MSSNLYYSEHAVFIVPDAQDVTWTGSGSWDSVYSTTNINNYIATLKARFPDDYFFVVVTANNLNPNKVPNVLTYRHLADGIGEDSITGVGVPNICRYAIGGSVIDGAYGVLDHEIGHNWGVFIGLQVGSGHWLSNSTATGQMADVYTDDGYVTIKQILGNPVDGFFWAAADNITRNETETYSDYDLYLQGLAESFPPLYVLNSPVYDSDQTVSYASVATYDQAWVEAHNGPRSPDYKTSDKRFRIGFVYVARDLAEVMSVYQPIERSIRHFVDGEGVDTAKFRFQVPFLVATKYRGSLDALLEDLDGNATPSISLTSGGYFTSSDGTATVPFTATDPDGTTPTVSCVPASASCSISGGNVVLTGLGAGSHFLTIKAEDAGGKKRFAHFVVDVQ